LETEWDYSGRKGRDGQKKKIGKANEKKGKVKSSKEFCSNLSNAHLAIKSHQNIL